MGDADMLNKLTFTMENYLEAIYELATMTGSARLTDIAARLSVTKSTANAAMSSLADKGLIENHRYSQIRLTEAGRKMASDVAEKHVVIRKFFNEVLEIDNDTADEDACAIEHVISDKSIDAMKRFRA
jgi:Mn-dependent DtxR family transcriptional regulator